MHRLYEPVCPMVEEATRAEEDPAVTFVRVRKLAEPIAGLARCESHRPTPRGGGRRPTPRLTEPWFCEPSPPRASSVLCSRRQQGL
ncbi:MAG: hypothetical protein DME00_34500 [Candidatus Rokuibacteriota bacterium]|nr:MAG: hypothetical protein DME00_34500 [Candidatus Rokubacteria bacterium]